jgi:lipoyl(octanoyl) transferase
MRIDSTHLHLRRMEQAIIEALADEGIDARSRCAEGPDYTGVWVEDRKIASIGVHVARGITTHGFAVNVDLDLTPFSWVVACGLPGTEMTSVAGELRGGSNRGTESAGQVDAGSRVDRFARPMVARFCERHGRHPRFVSPAELTLAPMPGEPVAELQAFVS